MRAILLQIILSIGLIVLATAIGHRFDSSLGITGIVMLYLAVTLFTALVFFAAIDLLPIYRTNIKFVESIFDYAHGLLIHKDVNDEIFSV